MGHEKHAQTEARIRSAMRELLAGNIPDELKCDVKSLCILAGVPRATLYRAYPHLKAEFDRQRTHARDNGQEPDPRLAQIERLKTEIAGLRERLLAKNAEIDELGRFKSIALSRIAAQQDEISQLRRQLSDEPEPDPAPVATHAVTLV